jgi:hypothetical protein
MITLAQFLCSNQQEVQDAFNTAAQHVQVSLLKDVRGLRWSMIGPALTERLKELLDIGFADIMLRSWKKFALVRKYLGPDAPADETVLIPLAQHSIRSRHNPHIQILRGGRELARITFPVTLELTLEGFALKIRNRRIEEIETGKLLAAGTLQCESVTLVEKKIQPVELPGNIKLPLRAAKAAGG